MAKSKAIIRIDSYGIYSIWDSESKKLPKIQQFTLDIPAEIDMEFGFSVNIKKAKGEKIRYCIYHPNIIDADGEIMPPFDGELHIRKNDWDFYLGDTIWAPIDTKIGAWRMTLEINNTIIAEKTFNVYSHDENQFWKRRGC
ncbi:DUF3859 domain-containing protein [Photobacterium phosphoreum]|uniref:DUF3859 domain-containing protein n=1 Tax=Photobacterium phosphoreum TaxID=659 RepID=UPI000D1699B9|nr:DUF3859 domain-containing protein [Photobacterium phosphoreum]MCD9472904.1 hypothetical protein [Photobacterium phosphoreum]PSW24778.1 DUF3859 domain-containing protein [Photobacterium phosphoreum]